MLHIAESVVILASLAFIIMLLFVLGLQVAFIVPEFIMGFSPALYYSSNPCCPTNIYFCIYVFVFFGVIIAKARSAVKDWYSYCKQLRKPTVCFWHTYCKSYKHILTQASLAFLIKLVEHHRHVEHD